MPAATTFQRVRRAGPRLSTAAVQRMQDLPWFAALSAEQRSWVGLVVQSGLAAFVNWLRDPTQPAVAEPAIFSAAPRELARAVTLQQTVALIRMTVDVLEEAVPSLAAPGDADRLEQAVLRYSREVAFAAAEVYAAAAEERGAWDARLEASVVEALVRGDIGEVVQSRATSLGWTKPEWVRVLVGEVPAEPEPAVAELRAAARHAGQCLLVGDSGDRLVLVLGGSGPHVNSLRQASTAFGPGPVVLGPVAADLVGAAGALREALAALAAVAAWPGAPRPVAAGELLAERAILGDPDAHRRLMEEVSIPLGAAGRDLLATVSAYLDGGSSVEATARELFLHPNTVRYRLRRVSEVIGYDVTQPRPALAVRLALVLGRARVTDPSGGPL